MSSEPPMQVLLESQHPVQEGSEVEPPLLEPLDEVPPCPSTPPSAEPKSLSMLPGSPGVAQAPPNPHAARATAKERARNEENICGELSQGLLRPRPGSAGETATR